VWAPFAVPAGIVTETLAVPFPGTGLGMMLPLRTVPVLGSSSRKLTAWPVLKLVICPVTVLGRLETEDESSVNAAAPTVTVPLFGLSAPRQLAWVGVTVYFQSPGATPCSVQLVPETVPEQAEPTDCWLLLVS
jgi:hypothetical protein